MVGDRVSLVGDLRGGPDALARVVRVHPREHVLRRTADDTDREERVYNLVLGDAALFVANDFLARSKPAAPAPVRSP